MKIAFMGTPDFAVPSFRKLAESRHTISAVVTALDRPAGRGLRIVPSPVTKVAREQNIPTLKPTDLKQQEFISQLQALEADLYVVVAFRILPPEVFKIPPKGTINLHASLLPKYRGAAPINWAIINGERETGLTTFFIEEKVDTGRMIFQRVVPIKENETAGELHDRLAQQGADLIVETVDAIADGAAPAIEQKGEMTRAPKITKEMTRIHWDKRNIEIHNLVRGLSPIPAAFTLRDGKIVKIFRTELSASPTDSTAAPGEVVLVDGKRGQLEVATGGGALRILEVQPESKRRMTVGDYLKGYPVKVGDRFD